MAMIRYRLAGSLLVATFLSGCCEAAYGPGKCVQMNEQYIAMHHLLPHTPIDAPAAQTQQDQQEQSQQAKKNTDSLAEEMLEAIIGSDDDKQEEAKATQLPEMPTKQPEVSDAAATASVLADDSQAMSTSKLARHASEVQLQDVTTSNDVNAGAVKTNSNTITTPFRKAPSVEVVEMNAVKKDTSTGDTASWLRY